MRSDTDMTTWQLADLIVLDVLFVILVLWRGRL